MGRRDQSRDTSALTGILCLLLDNADDEEIKQFTWERNKVSVQLTQCWITNQSQPAPNFMVLSILKGISTALADYPKN